ncbi:MAG: hypothetical protein NUW01_01270, partial [Gemmatimonadaceae bacterium]|nr:hypothetical protein [Gemmatimonadaceae bacterium]
QDPSDPDGDITALQNIASWLKPGGWVYLDVPFTPEGFHVKGTRYRGYDFETLVHRLKPASLRLEHLGYVASDQCRAWLPETPTEPMTRDPKHPYYYAAMLLEKPK